MTEERYMEIKEYFKELLKEYSKLSAFEKLDRSFDSICHICGSAKPPVEIPTIVVMNEKFFTDWFYWCRENKIDYRYYYNCTVMLDKESPFSITWKHK